MFGTFPPFLLFYEWIALESSIILTEHEHQQSGNITQPSPNSFHLFVLDCFSCFYHFIIKTHIFQE